MGLRHGPPGEVPSDYSATERVGSPGGAGIHGSAVGPLPRRNCPELQQRSPLLSDAASALGELAEQTTWIVLCEGMSSLVPPPELGALRLVGRLLSGSHIAFVYSSQITLLLEPVLNYLQQSTWIDPEHDAAVRFLLGSLRMALPEALLGFFKSQGVLSKESVLGRLGLAAAVAYFRGLDLRWWDRGVSLIRMGLGGGLICERGPNDEPICLHCEWDPVVG